ncbi:hypothetical protein CS542_04525 [Pedobacter sp. IW39]|nr:hypothetical protein CS542_04525 [Pedobacter sp. IW39]
MNHFRKNRIYKLVILLYCYRPSLFDVYAMFLVGNIIHIAVAFIPVAFRIRGRVPAALLSLFVYCCHHL